MKISVIHSGISFNLVRHLAIVFSSVRPSYIVWFSFGPLCDATNSYNVVTRRPHLTCSTFIFRSRVVELQKCPLFSTILYVCEYSCYLIPGILVHIRTSMGHETFWIFISLPGRKELSLESNVDFTLSGLLPQSCIRSADMVILGCVFSGLLLVNNLRYCAIGFDVEQY